MENRKRTSILAGAACFPIAAMLTVLACFCLYSLTKLGRLSADDFGIFIVLYLFAAWLKTGLIFLYIAVFSVCTVFAAFYIKNGILLLTSTDAQQVKKSLSFPFGASIAIAVMALYPAGVGLGRVIVHGPQGNLVACVLFGLLPLLFSVACIVFNRIALCACKRENP